MLFDTYNHLYFLRLPTRVSFSHRPVEYIELAHFRCIAMTFCDFCTVMSSHVSLRPYMLSAILDINKLVKSGSVWVSLTLAL